MKLQSLSPLLRDPPLFHSIGEDTCLLCMYAEVTHCRTICYLLVKKSLALGTTFVCSNGEIRPISVCIANFYISDSDGAGNCLYVRWFKIYTSVSLRLNIQNINWLIFILKINYRHVHAIEFTDRACKNGSQRAKYVPFYFFFRPWQYSELTVNTAERLNSVN